jgi:DNA invertase Pin-like site-specific DNA recombinase
LRDLIAMLDDLKERGVKFRSLTEQIDNETPTGRAMWQMIGVLAELERSLISERTRAGVKAAQRRGVKFGRFNADMHAGQRSQIQSSAHTLPLQRVVEEQSPHT